MPKFKGFSDSESLTPLPDSFLGELLSEISTLDELKVVLMALWWSAHVDGPARPIRTADFLPEELGLQPAEITAGIDKAVTRGVLLKSGEGASLGYFINSPAGRLAAAAGLNGPEGGMSGPLVKPNAFKLYEENIGPLTPLVADALKAAEDDYPEVWIAEAIELAVTNNKRSWAYCEAILKRWKEEGRGEKQTRRDHQAARQRDVEKKIRKFIDD